jgi:hypothetical protein
MAFSVFVELLNMRVREGRPVELHQAYQAAGPGLAKVKPSAAGPAKPKRK